MGVEMTQKVFDVENKEDMDLLWSILPDDVVRILKTCYTSEKYYGENNNVVGITNFFNINWHDKTEITRPVNYEDMIGCVCWFEDGDNGEKTLDILTGFNPDDPWCFETASGSAFSKFTPAKKSELKFWGEQDE